MLIDTHCHVNFFAYKDDSDEVIKRCLDKDIWLINVGSQLSTSQRVLEIADKYEKGVYAIVGLHPIHLYKMHVDEAEQGLDFVTRAEVFDYDVYKKLAQQPKVVGIGEMGIDYFHLPQNENPEEVKAKQKQTFLQGLKLAKELKKPITIHTRPSKGTQDAYDDEIDILQKANYFNGVVHCFVGSIEQAKKFIDMGLLLSFTGIITFKNAKKVQAIVKIIPLDKIMIETDSPYLSPEPFRGKRNEPSFVEFIAKKIAELKGVSYDTVANTTTQTSRDFFNI